MKHAVAGKDTFLEVCRVAGEGGGIGCVNLKFVQFSGTCSDARSPKKWIEFIVGYVFGFCWDLIGISNAIRALEIYDFFLASRILERGPAV